MLAVFYNFKGGIERRVDGEPQADAHPRGITLHRHVDIPGTPRKLDNLIELPRNLVCAFPKLQIPAGLPTAAFLRTAPALRFGLPHSQNGTV